MHTRSVDAHFRLLLLFPIFTLFQSISFLGWINKALLICVILLQVTIQFKGCKVKRKWVGLLGILLVVHIYTLLQTHFPLYNSNMLFYFGFWILLALYYLDYPETVRAALEANLNYTKRIIQTWSVIVGVSAVFPSSYVINRAWGSGRYFTSIAGDPFRLAPACLMITILILVLYCYSKKKSYLWYLLVPMYSFLMCGSRTYLGIGLLVIIAFWYIYCEKKLYFYLSLLPLGIFFIFLIINSAAGAKIQSTIYLPGDPFDKWGKLTNGRTVFWVIDIKYFLKENILNQFLGCGINFDYEVTALYYTSAHWAHNDFISILLNFGYVGLAVYLFSIWKLFKKYLFSVKMPWVVISAIFLIWFINAMFNMFYTYTCSMISFPILLVALQHYYVKNGDCR